MIISSVIDNVCRDRYPLLLLLFHRTQTRSDIGLGDVMYLKSIHSDHIAPLGEVSDNRCVWLFARGIYTSYPRQGYFCYSDFHQKLNIKHIFHRFPLTRYHGHCTLMVDQQPINEVGVWRILAAALSFATYSLMSKEGADLNCASFLQTINWWRKGYLGDLNYCS
jgi:ribonuclease BN (tRNA processing enzyme)